MNRWRNPVFGIIPMLCLVVLISGCAGTPTPAPTITPTLPPTVTPTPAPTSTPTLPPTATAVPLIIGSWEMNITQAENADLAGGWKFDFLDNGRYIVTWKLRDAALGTYKLSGDQLVITDESGPNMCNGALAKATYKWAVESDSLKLTAVDDPCNARRSINTLKAWGKKK